MLSVEGERATPLRMVRAVKNRFGPTDEVGCFRLDGDGLTDLPDPSGLFLSRAHGLPGLEAAAAPPGTCVTVTLEGRRPLVAEVQALVAPPAGAHPRRAVSGLDPSRLSMVLAVLETRLKLKLAPAGRLRVDRRRGPDHRVRRPISRRPSPCSAPLSDCRCRPISSPSARWAWRAMSAPVRAIERRLAAAARLGFPAGHRAHGIGSVPDVMFVVEAGDLARRRVGAAPLPVRSAARLPPSREERVRSGSPFGEVLACVRLARATGRLAERSTGFTAPSTTVGSATTSRVAKS